MGISWSNRIKLRLSVAVARNGATGIGSCHVQHTLDSENGAAIQTYGSARTGEVCLHFRYIGVCVGSIRLIGGAGGGEEI